MIGGRRCSCSKAIHGGTGTEVNHTFVSIPNGAEGVAVDPEFIYWSDDTTGSLGRVKIDGTELEPEFLTTPGEETRNLCVTSRFALLTEELEFIGSGMVSVKDEDLGNDLTRVTITSVMPVTASGQVIEAEQLEFQGSGGVSVKETEPAGGKAKVNIEGNAALLANEGMGVLVLKISEKGIARPTRFKQYTWFCKEEPTNLGDFDIWIEAGP